MAATAAQPLQDGRFLLLEALGRGGMGTVFRAFDRVEQKMVALKTLDRVERAGPQHPLAMEFELWTRLKHPNVVRAHEMMHARCGPFPRGTPYLILEFFRGGPANEVLIPGRIGAADVEEFAARVLRGLAHVHDRGLVHRDLKPGNILVGGARRGPGKVKLTDFGLAERAGSVREPGRVSGSFPYLAPEMVLGGGVDGRADLYALGIVLFLVATGTLPFDTRDPGRMIEWHVSGTTPDPCSLRPDLPDRFGRFIRRLTERRREDRPRSAVEALFLLGGRPAPGDRRKRRAVGRGELAVLRMALDQARVGARRVVTLPRESSRAAEWVREAKVLAEVRGLAFHTLGRGRSALGRTVFRLLLEDGTAHGLLEKHRLHRGLPLGLLGGSPVWDRMRGDRHDDDPAARRRTARNVAGFLLDVARRRTLVLHLDRAAHDDPLTCAVVGNLRRAAAAPSGPASMAGGLLLLVRDSERVLPGAEQVGHDLVAADVGADDAAERRQ